MTKEHTEQQNVVENQARPPEASPSNDAGDAVFAAHKPKRTLGLKIFDATFYGGVVNTAIFLASTASTYWTYHGNTVGKPNGGLRWISEKFYKRRPLIENILGKIGITGEAGKIGTTVFWSFFDGTLFAPLIKIIEDRREKIALSIDTVLGTKADDMRAYDAEPKQGWKSVLAGRLETLSIVLPVAIIMEKTGGNKKIFYDGGEKIMGLTEKHLPTLDKKMISLVSAPHAPKLTAELPVRKKALWHVLTFEAFYTSICTFGTYLFSRGFARHHPKKEKPNHTPRSTHTSAQADTLPQEVVDSPDTSATEVAKPSPTIHKPAASERLTAQAHPTLTTA